ncbi:MAG: ribokinase [Verrucomicrobia bacterium]|nr:ribokinase [Verrucomicrobiota bacterium]
MAPRPILVIGSSNTDMIVQLPRLPGPGETLLGGRFTTAPGGKGANQAVAAARAGGQVVFVARVGRDVMGDQAVAGFARDRLRIEHIRRDPAAPSGVALIFVARDGQNSIAVAPGANAALSPADVRRARGAFVRAGACVLQLEIPLATVQAAAALAAAHRVPVILNPAPARPLPNDLLTRISILTPNETEAERLTGVRVTSETTARQAARVLRRRGVGTVIVTLGARGALVCGPLGEHRVPAFKVKAVDTTAAGDVFNGALACALAEGRDLLAAVRFANAAAALSVTRLGAQPSAPKRRDIDAFLRRAAD